MALLDTIKGNWKKLAVGVALAGAITLGITQVGKKDTPALEQRVTEKQPFYVYFGSPEKKYSDATETYGMGLAVLEALAKENGKPMTESDKNYFIQVYLDTDDKDGVSPKELSDYINGKKADGTERKWAKDLKAVPTKEDGFGYTYQVDLNPAELSRLNTIIAKHATVRHARYETQDEKEMWRYHAMKWAADKFGKEGYLNTDSVNKYEAHVNKIKGELK